jgi:peptide/nickel transport system substrate-binding protein
MIRGVISLISMSSVVFLLVGCGGNGKTPVKNAGSKDSSKTLSYQDLQKKAEGFVPKVGKKGGQMVLSTFSDPKSFNPITSTEASTSEFTQYIYEGLVKSNGVTLLPEPNLSDSWEIKDSGLVWIFHIRPGVLWSDGVPFSAYDVEFTFNDLIFNKNINPNSSRDIFVIEGKKITVKALDSSKVQFTLPFPYAPFLRAMGQEILPKHKYEAVVRKGTFSTALGLQTSLKDMVGTGPYLIETYISSQKVVFKTNPNYWKVDSEGTRLPYIDKIIYTIVADQNAEYLKFKRGEIDFLMAKGEDYPDLKKDEAAQDYTVYRLGPATNSLFLLFNQNAGEDAKTRKSYVNSVKLSWFTNVNFRKAISYAIDRDNIIKIVLNGLGYPQWSSMTPSQGYFYNDKTTQYPYDIAKAKQLLAQEGFVDKNGDGILEDKNGTAVEVSFVTNSGNNVRVKMAEMIRKDLELIGIKVHFQQLEFNSLIQKIDNPPFDWDLILIGLTGGVEPHFGKNVWHSSGTLHMWYPRQAKPATAWEAAIDSIFDAGVKIIDVAKRKELYDRWQQIVSDEVPLIYTVLPERIYCIYNKFENLNPCPNGGLLHNLEYVYLK